MLDNSYLPEGITAKELYIKVSDGVELKVFDFTPLEYDPARPVVVFVAGWISLISGWKDVLNVLTPNYRTLYIETREKISARLPKRKGIDFSIERMGQDIGEILKEMLSEDQNFYFVGSSMGSTAILDFLSLNKARPRQSFLISPICKFEIPAWALTLAKVVHPGFYSAIRPIAKWYLRNFRLDKKNEPEQVTKYEGTIDAAEPKRLKATTLAISSYSLWEKLEHLKSPVCIIGAKTDTLHSINELEKMVKCIPSARLELMQSNKETHSEKAGAFIADQISRLEISSLLSEE